MKTAHLESDPDETWFDSVAFNSILILFQSYKCEKIHWTATMEQL